MNCPSYLLLSVSSATLSFIYTFFNHSYDPRVFGHLNSAYTSTLVNQFFHHLYVPRTSSIMLSTFRTGVKDIELANPPTDSISRIEFSPTTDILAVASWDNNVS